MDRFPAFGGSGTFARKQFSAPLDRCRIRPGPGSSPPTPPGLICLVLSACSSSARALSPRSPAFRFRASAPCCTGSRVLAPATDRERGRGLPAIAGTYRRIGIPMKLVGLTVTGRADCPFCCLPGWREGVAQGCGRWSVGFVAEYRAGAAAGGLRRVAVSGLDGLAAGVAGGNPAAPDEHL